MTNIKKQIKCETENKGFFKLTTISKQLNFKKIRININTNNLIEAVTIGSQMACKSNVVPIFENTKITVRSGLITASSFNGETSITKSVNTQCHDDIPETSFLVNKKDFLDVLGTIGDETVQVEIGGNNIRIIHGSGVVSLPTSDINDFPIQAVETDTREYSVDTQSFIRLIDEAKGFVGRDELRPVLTGVRIRMYDNKAEAASSDATLLYKNSIGEDTGVFSETILPSYVIPIIIRTFKDSHNIRLSTGSRTVIIKGDNDSEMTVRRIEGAFPNVDSVIPNEEECRTVIKIGVFFLESALKRMLVTASSSHPVVKFEVKGGALTLETIDEDYMKSSKENAIADVQGEDITIGFNGMKLQTCLNAIKGDTVTIAIKSASKGALLKDSGDNDKKVLIMPMNLN